MQASIRNFLVWLVLWPLFTAPATAESVASFDQARLEQLVAPIALYPDALVAQILMASTYPLQVTQAARWQQRHAALRDSELDRAAQREPWDPSVKSLLHFPDVLKRMNENLDWTKDLGDAVLAQQPAVMEAIQRMRRYAYDSGSLRTNDRQQVVVEEQVIRVQPATEVVYVPSYNPTVVYGSYWTPASWYYPLFAYPAAYWYPVGYAAPDLVAFGIGVIAGVALWGHCDWHDHWIGYHDYHDHWHGGGDIHVDHSVTVNNFNSSGPPQINRWEHNPFNRRGVAYRDPETAKHYEAIRDATRRGLPAPGQIPPFGGQPGSGARMGQGPGVAGGPQPPRNYDMMGHQLPPGEGPGSFGSRPPGAPIGGPATGTGNAPGTFGAVNPPGKRPPMGTAPSASTPPPSRALPRFGDSASPAQPKGAPATGWSQPPRGSETRSSQAPQMPSSQSGTQFPRDMQTPRATNTARSAPRPQSAPMPTRPQGGMAVPGSRPGGSGFAAPQAPRASSGAPPAGRPGGGAGPFPGGAPKGAPVGFGGPGGFQGGHR